MSRTKNAGTHCKERKPRARDRAWQSMRILRMFTLPDLIATAEIGESNVMAYVARLERSGYLRCIQPRQSGRKGGHASWRLIRNSGPYAPRLTRAGAVFDPNTTLTHEMSP
jgi:hypothetical protein